MDERESERVQPGWVEVALVVSFWYLAIMVIVGTVRDCSELRWRKWREERADLVEWLWSPTGTPGLQK